MTEFVKAAMRLAKKRIKARYTRFRTKLREVERESRANNYRAASQKRSRLVAGRKKARNVNKRPS